MREVFNIEPGPPGLYGPEAIVSVRWPGAAIVRAVDVYKEHGSGHLVFNDLRMVVGGEGGLGRFVIVEFKEPNLSQSEQRLIEATLQQN